MQQTKLCRGPSHPEPVYLPATTEFFRYRSEGRWLRSLCRQCENYAKAKEPTVSNGLIHASKVRWIFQGLVANLGTVGASNACNITPTMLRRIVNGDTKQTRRGTARKAIKALRALRQEARAEATIRARTPAKRALRHSLTDPMVVPTGALAAALVEFEKELDPRYSPVGQGPDAEGITPLTIYSYFRENLGISDKTIYRILHGVSQFTALSLADTLLTAIHRNHLLSTGEIPVIPNPRWSQEKWHAYMREHGCA